FVIDDGISANAPAAFIFAGEDGVISAWRPLLANPLIAVIEASDPDAIYKGLAISAAGGVSRLYATNFHEGPVHIFHGNFHRIDDETNFQDPNIPAGFAPFGIQNINGNIFVTYAKQDDDKEDDVAGPGNGFVDIYDNTGILEKRFVSQGHLNSPWGVVLT